MSNKRKRDETTDIEKSGQASKVGRMTKEGLLWMPSTFWERIYILLPKNKIYLTCRRGLWIQRQYCRTFTIIPDSDDIRYSFRDKLAGVNLSRMTSSLERYFGNLEVLVLQGCLSLTNQVFAPLGEGLTSLRHLDLANCCLTGGEIFDLPWITNLVSLNLSNCRLELDVISDDIEVFDRNPKKFQLTGLKKCTKLQELCLGGFICIDDTALSEILSLTQLQKLDISQFLNQEDLPGEIVEECFFHSENLQRISSLTKLDSLTLVGCTQISREDFGFLKKLTNLVDLDLTRSKIDHQGLKDLIELKNLRNLGLGDSWAPAFSTGLGFDLYLRALQKLDQIRHLCLGNNIHQLGVGGHLDTGDVIYPNYSRITQLESLCISGYRISVRHCYEIEKLIHDNISLIPNINQLYTSHPAFGNTSSIVYQKTGVRRNLGFLRIKSKFCRSEIFYSTYSTRSRWH